jgi:hypothetical protein
MRLRRRAEALGYQVGGLRRGVLARGEPDDRKLWTLRLAKDGVERMIAVAPHATAAYPPGKAEELGPRLRELCPLTMLLATGFGNAGLRAAAQAAGCLVQEHDSDDDALLAALSAVSAPPPAAASAPTPPDHLTTLLESESPSVEALTEVVRAFRRPDRALRVVHRLQLDDARTAALLRAVDAATEPGRTLPEGSTLAIVAAARGPQTRALLVGGPLQARFAGAGIDAVVDLAKVLLDGGWEVHRVLRGPTRRETQTHPALDALAAGMSGLWRLLVRKDDGSGASRKGEVWFLADLPPEARAGVPILLLEDWQRVVVAGVDPELLGWWGTLGAPALLGWTGSEGASLLAAVDGFVVRSQDAAEADRSPSAHATDGSEEGSAAS